MQISLVITEDGSHSLKNEILDDNYHSMFGAIQESKHVFIKNGFEKIKRQNIKVLEIGFGTGLNSLLTKVNCELNKKSVIYHAVENIPIEEKIFSKLNYCEILKIEKSILNEIHFSQWGEEINLSEFFKLKKINIDFNKMSIDEKYDLIYFDAFSPRKQPEIWEKENFYKLYDCLNKNGILSTYSAKGELKRNLKDAGFRVLSVAGPIGKREITLACKD
tara:strand:+ start:1131 stop:1787 length:657 start_codon:yes stop_codon:yes gene_type:complete